MADYYWHGRADNGRWTDPGNWGLYSVDNIQDPNGNPSFPISANYTNVYINNGNWLGPNSTDFSDTAVIYYDYTPVSSRYTLSSLCIQPANALRLSIIASDTAAQTVELYDRFIINSNVDLLEFSITNIECPPKNIGSVFANIPAMIIDTNGYHVKINPTGTTLQSNVSIIGRSAILNSNLTVSSFNYFRADSWWDGLVTNASKYSFAAVQLNGFGITAGNMALGTNRNISGGDTKFYVYISFYYDSNTGNHSFLEVTGYDGQAPLCPGLRTFQTNPLVSNRNPYGSILGPSPNQPPILVVSGAGGDGYYPTPGTTDSDGLSRTIYTWHQLSNSTVIEANTYKDTRTGTAGPTENDIMDIYVVAGADDYNNRNLYSGRNNVLPNATPSSWGVNSPTNWVYTLFYQPSNTYSRTAVIGNFDCSGSSIGNLTTGPGCPHPVSFMAKKGIPSNGVPSSSTNTYSTNPRTFAFTRNIVFPDIQMPLLISGVSGYPIFYFLHNSTGQRDDITLSSGYEQYTGWIIDFKGATFNTHYYIGATSAYAATLVIAIDSNVDLFFISSFSTQIIYVNCGNSDTSRVFLCPDALLIWAISVNISRGMISTVYGGGTCGLVSAQAADRFDPVWAYISYDDKAAGKAKYVTPTFTMTGGVLDLYTAGDIRLAGCAWTQYATAPYGAYYASNFIINAWLYGFTDTPSINFNFLPNQDTNQYDLGMIQTDLFYCLGGTRVTANFRVYSSTGNIVSAASDTASGIPPQIAITVGYGGIYNTGVYISTLYNSAQNSSDWIWQDNSNIVLTQLLQNGTPADYQLKADSLVALDQNKTGWESWQLGGPVVVQIKNNSNQIVYSNNYFLAAYKQILATSGKIFFVISKQVTRANTKIIFSSNNASVAPKIAGLDTASVADNVEIYAVGIQIALRSLAYSLSLEITNPSAGHFFGGTGVYGYYVKDLTFTGGLASTPSQIDQPKNTNIIFPNIYIKSPAYVYLTGRTDISNSTLNFQGGTLDQSLNTSDSAPTVSKVDFDHPSADRVFIHGSLDGSNSIAFNIVGSTGVVWASSYHFDPPTDGTVLYSGFISKLKITTINKDGIRLAPGIIKFYNSGGSITIYPGNHNGYTLGVEASGTYNANANSPGIDTPDQNALIFDFQDSYASITFTNSSDPSTPMCVQTLILGKYKFNNSWNGWSGTLSFVGDMIFCGTDQNLIASGYRSPSYFTLLYMFADTDVNSSFITQYGGLITSYDTVLSSAGSKPSTLFFQGFGQININTRNNAVSPVIVSIGTSTYQYVMQVNQPGLPSANTILPSNFNNFDFNNFTAGPYTSGYTVYGSYNQLNLMGGYISFTGTQPDYSAVTDIVYTVTATQLTIRDTIGPQSYGGYIAVNLDQAQINLGNNGVTSPLIMYPPTTSTYFSPTSSQLNFYNGSIFNAYLGDYSNIAIGTFKNASSDPTPTITINPCTDFSGSTQASATFYDLVASGQGPAVFKFTSGSTSTFRYFSYNDTLAPFSATSQWYGYSNTLSNTVLKSTQPGYQFNISIPTPHLGTIKNGILVSNMTIQDSAALNPYIWFAPGTVNRYANTGTSFLPGRAVSASLSIKGTNVPYYNYNAGGNSGWIFNQQPNVGMDMVFWDNSTFNWNTTTNAAGILNRFTHTFYTQSIN